MGTRNHQRARACRLRGARRLDACRHGTVAPLDLDLDVGARPAHIVTADGFIGRVAQHLASPDIEFRAVPRAGHLMTLDLAFGKRTLLMWAEIVEPEDLPVDCEQDDLFALEHDEMRVARRNLARARRLDEFAHELVLLAC